MLPLNKCTLENMATAQQQKIDCKLKFIPDLYRAIIESAFVCGDSH